jgi:hypothetical protein
MALNAIILAFIFVEFKLEFAQKHHFLMRLMLVFIHTIFLIHIVIYVLSHPIDDSPPMLTVVVLIPLC